MKLGLFFLGVCFAITSAFAEDYRVDLLFENSEKQNWEGTFVFKKTIQIDTPNEPGLYAVLYEHENLGTHKVDLVQLHNNNAVQVLEDVAARKGVTPTFSRLTATPEENGGYTIWFHWNHPGGGGYYSEQKFLYKNGSVTLLEDILHSTRYQTTEVLYKKEQSSSTDSESSSHSVPVVSVSQRALTVVPTKKQVAEIVADPLSEGDARSVDQDPYAEEGGSSRSGTYSIHSASAILLTLVVFVVYVIIKQRKTL